MLHKTNHHGMRLASLLAALALPAGALAAPNPQTPLAGSKIAQWKSALPLLITQPGGTMATIVTNTPVNGPLQLSFCEFQAQMLPPGMPATWVWGYIQGPTCPTKVQDTYIGPVLVNTRGTPTTIRWTNQLPTVDLTNVLAYKYSTDQTIHWADPLGAEMNMCKMGAPDPATMNLGIPAYKSDCALNFGEWWNPTTKTGGFNPVGIAAVPHLHGGEVPPVIDGGPDSWFTSFNAGGTNEKGHDYYSNPNFPVGANEAVYSYPNGQSAAPLWFHDHTLGATRLNVYAGLAGAYYLLDPAQETYFTSINMQPVTEVIPVVLQDRQFDVNGQLYFPTDFPGGLNGPSTNPQHPYWIPEFLGDTIAINGKVWPTVNVEPRRYRFLFLNGSNARTYEMFLVNPVTKVMGPPFWVIGNDAGFLDYPVMIDPNAAKPAQNHLIMQPGERYEVVVDFGGLPVGTTLVIKNVAKAPYPGGLAPQGTTTGQLLKFNVVACPAAGCTTYYDPASGVALRDQTNNKVVRLASNGLVAPGVTISKIRQLTLNEFALLTQTATDPVTGVANTIYPGGPVEILVNNTAWAGKNRPDFQAVTINGITEYVSEFPKEGETELWEIVNTTMDAHPIHTHLASFQILNRQNYDTKGFTAAYNAAFTWAPPLSPPATTNGGTCTNGMWCPGFGPPYAYDPVQNPKSGGKWGGNPDVTPFLANAVFAPDPNETGWKDTLVTYPGMVNRFIVRWAPQETLLTTQTGSYPFSPNDGTGGAVGDSHGYVWHCHIIDHEDNEMMRPDVISPLALPNCGVGVAPPCRSYVKGVNY